VNLAVKDADQSVRFCSTLFGVEQRVLKSADVKWMTEDPRVNFAMSTRSEDHEVDHLGIQVGGREELGEIAGRLESTGLGVCDKGEARCCYAHSHKARVRGPEGLAWESFFTFGSDPLNGEGMVVPEPAAAGPYRPA